MVWPSRAAKNQTRKNIAAPHLVDAVRTACGTVSSEKMGFNAGVKRFESELGCLRSRHVPWASEAGRRVTGTWLAWLAACSVLLLTLPASATLELRGFSRDELDGLNSGSAIERRFELPRHGAKYLGAVSYGVLDQPCKQLSGMWQDPVKHLAKALPATRQVELAQSGNSFTRLKIEHGNSLVQGNWGALYRVSDDGMTARFWLDTGAPRDVKDVFGYFRLSPWTGDRCLVTAAVAVDPGDGLLASMFRSMIHNYLVRTAARIQRYIKSGEFAG